tara:strand:- start:17 stop:1141 length:1125 start_codon:yes stop_codon:yes gene_type:complete
MKNIPYSVVDLSNNDHKKIINSIKSGWLAHGPSSKRFEKEFKKFTKAKYAITLSSCTAGLHLSCLALGIKKGDEVIVPAQTHAATAHSVEYTGAKAVFADIDYFTGNISLDSVKKKINKNTKAIIPVHMAGKSCDMNGLLKIAKKYKLKIIEDCAHGLGSIFEGKHVGNIGSTGSFSFYPTKQITTGEGGMLITNDSKLYNKINKLKAFGIDTPPQLRKKPGVYDIKYLGFNYRMTDFQAEMGLNQLLKYKKYLEIRKRNAKLYHNHFKGLSHLISLPLYSINDSYFVFQILLKNKLVRDKVANTLKKNKIGYGIQYATPVPLLQYYKNKYRYKTSGFPNAVNYSNTCISLPVHQKLNKTDIIKIVKVISSAID